jgi:hypothetical protein
MRQMTLSTVEYQTETAARRAWESRWEVSMARPFAIELANEITQSKASPQQELVPKQDIKLPMPSKEIGLERGLGL